MYTEHLFLDEETLKEPLLCDTCQGSGGWDISEDCETYTEWKDCPDCQGTGMQKENN